MLVSFQRIPSQPRPKGSVCYLRVTVLPYIVLPIHGNELYRITASRDAIYPIRGVRLLLVVIAESGMDC
jgi:hypothetical protein